MNRFNSKRTILLIVFLVCLVAVLVILFTYSGLFDKVSYLFGGDNGKEDEEYFNARHDVVIDGEKYRPRDKVKSYLLIGIDKEGKVEKSYSYQNFDQSDFLVMLVVDDNDKSYSLIQINRDTMADVRTLDIWGNDAGTERMQIALSHTYGDAMRKSCANTALAVSKLFFGLPVDYYASIRFDAVPILNDYVGGVTLTVPVDLTEIDESYTEGAVITLEGEESLRFVRSRQGVGNQTNIERMVRQRTYMEAYMEALLKKGYDDESFLMTYTDVSPYLVTNFGADSASKLFDKLETYTYKGMRQIEGESGYDKEDHACFYADEKSLKEIAIDLLCDKK